MRTEYLINAIHNVHPHHLETLLDTPTAPCVHVLCQRSPNGPINSLAYQLHLKCAHSPKQHSSSLSMVFFNIVSEMHLNHCCS